MRFGKAVRGVIDPVACPRIREGRVFRGTGVCAGDVKVVIRAKPLKIIKFGLIMVTEMLVEGSPNEHNRTIY
jgi:hypothetical protein